MPQYTEFPEPVAKNDDEILISVKAAAIKHFDKGSASGKHYSAADNRQNAIVIGGDGVGVLADGTRIFALGVSGMIAEKAVIDKSRMVKLPEGLDDATAAALPNAVAGSAMALRFRAGMQPGETVLINGTMGEKHTALGTLGSMTNKEADTTLLAWLNKTDVPKELRLDLLDAAEKRNDPAIRAKLQSINVAMSKEDPLAPFRAALYGGNAADGKKIFFERAEAACVRCHKIVGQGSEGGEVGPELTHVGANKPREYILESIVFPNKQIAQGFESLLVTMKDGTSYAGVVKSETETNLVLNSPEDGLLTIKKENITARERGLSSMPEGMTTLLSKHDLRDLVEFLSSCK